MGRRFLNLLAPITEYKDKIRSLKRYEYWISDEFKNVHVGVFYTTYIDSEKVKLALEQETSLKFNLCEDVRYWRIE